MIIEGEGGHAGAVLMPDRHDAFLAAAEIALAVEASATVERLASIPLRTVGVCDVFPGAVNSIPSRVRMEVDVRDIDEARRDAVLRKIEQACEEVARRRGVNVKVELVNADPPAQCAPHVVEALVQSCEAHRPAIRTHDQPRVSRLAVYVADRAHGDAVYSVPRRREPSPG